MTENLLVWAEQQFWLAEEINGHGITRKEVLAQVEKTTGQKPNNLRDQLFCPASLQHVWEWFVLLLGAYDAPMSGIKSGPDEWRADIAVLTGIKPHAFEMQIIMRLVTLWRQKRHGLETGSR